MIQEYANLIVSSTENCGKESQVKVDFFSKFEKILYQDVRLNLNRFVYIYEINSFPLIFNAVNFSLGCAGCGEDIRSGQSLLALEKQWHLWCFTCTKCGCLLAGEYMGR